MNWKNLSRKRKAYILALVTVIGILVWAFVSAGIITHNFNRSQLSTQEDKQEALINGLILTETKEAEKYWEIYGETGTYNSTNEIALLDNVIGNFYDENDEVSMSFESSKGTYNSKKSEIILYNDTHIVLKDGISLKADCLKWSGNKNPIVARGHIVVQKGQQMLASLRQLIHQKQGKLHSHKAQGQMGFYDKNRLFFLQSKGQQIIIKKLYSL